MEAGSSRAGSSIPFTGWIRSKTLPMSLPGSQRRDQRRRLLVSWIRAPKPRPAAAAARRSMAEYSPEALPERQPAIATLLPTGLGGLALAAAAIAVVLGAALAVGGHEPLLAAAGRAAGPRFARTMAAVRDCFDPRSALSLAGWLAHLLLFAAAAVALVVRFMRRHRRDDYRGRYRAWGWLAGLLVMASLAAQVPVGRVVGGFVAEATGVMLGPQGCGWWLILSGTLLGAVSLWAVLPLHERLATALWLAAGLTAWAASAACAWLGDGRDLLTIVMHATWAAGSGLVALAVLAAARSVIREVRGEAGRDAKPRRQTEPARPQQPARAAAANPWPTDHAGGEAADEADDVGYTAAEYTDGSDDDRSLRHLSKAERKRLRKLARLNRAA